MTVDKTSHDPTATSAPTDPLARFWSLPAAQVLTGLGSAADGLTTARAAEIAAEQPAGPTGPHQTPAWKLLTRQFTSPIELILVGATVLSGILGDWTDAFIILVILLLSGLLGFWQERNAGKAMAALLATVAVTARVRRDGSEVELPLAQVVPGDVAVLSAGDMLPGDGLVLAANDLTVDESALTGETFPVDKVAGIVPASAPLNQRSNVVFEGTHVTSGTGHVLVVRTGATTELAAISARLGTHPPQTGFEKGMTRFGLLLTRLMVLFVIAIFVINLVLERPLLDSALFSLALAVGLTPQLLPAIVSISLAQGARMMAHHRVIVRRLDAIEDFGSMTVLCSDKTGTMTAGRIRLGSVEGVDSTPDADGVIAELASLNAGLQSGLRNPIDEAILTAHPLPASARAIDEVPYDFQRKRLSVLTARDDRHVLITKGALDAVLQACTEAKTSEGIVPIAQVSAAVRQRFADLSAQGFRVLGIATRDLGDRTNAEVTDETGLTLVGLLSFADPVKPDARETVAQLAASGVSVRMLTGDNRLVAAHIAGEVGLDAGTVYTGADVDARDDTALASAVRDVQVFSELTPVQKERIVRALRAAGHVVGYLGDGINDAPPLHAADIGITVDTAVPVAKESAAIVLLDKDLKVILDGVTQGRRTFANTTKYIFMTTSANFGNILSMAIASAVLPYLPLLAGQILLINLLTDLPATTIATDSVDAAQLRRPQRWNVRLIRNYMIVFGALSSVFDLTTFAVLLWGFHAGMDEFRSAWFLGSILTEVAVLFVLRTRGPFYRSRPSRWLVLSSAAVAVVTVGILYSPLAAPLQLIPISLELLLIVLAIVLAYVVATELVKRVFWARHAAVRGR